MDKSKTTYVNLTPRAREIIESIREDTGVPNTEATARIFEWFTSLDRKLRIAVLTRDEDTKREMARLVIAEMAGESGDSGDMPADDLQAVRIARKALDRLERILIGRGNIEVDANEKAPTPKRRGR